MADIKRSNKLEHFPIFDPINSATIKEWADKLNKYLHNVVTTLGLEKSIDFKMCRNTLYEIFERIEKRRIYFHIYHGGMKMGEINEGALLVFWILKLMPFRVRTLDNTVVNTRVAYTVFINLLHYVANKSNPKRKVNIKSKLMDETLYAFRYRDLSKEAIMLLAESYLY